MVDGKAETLCVNDPPPPLKHDSIMDFIEGQAVWILLEVLVIFLGMVVSYPTTFTRMRRICEGEFKLTLYTVSCIA